MIQEEFEKGREKERLNNASMMKKPGVATKILIQVIGLSQEEIEKL